MQMTFFMSLLLSFSLWSMEPNSHTEELQKTYITQVRELLDKHQDLFKPTEETGTLKPRQIEALVDLKIKDLAAYYSLLAKKGLVIEPDLLKDEDIAYFVNLNTDDMFWNSNSTLETDLKWLGACGDRFKNLSCHSGGCNSFEKFSRLGNKHNACYVWFETGKAFSVKELNGNDGPKPVDKNTSSEFEQIYRKDLNLTNKNGLIEIAGKTYQRMFLFNGKYLDIPKDWNPRQTNLFMSELRDDFPLKEQFNNLSIFSIKKLQHAIHLSRKLDYLEEKGSLKTIHLFWPTYSIVPRWVVLDAYCLSWLLPLGSTPTSKDFLFPQITDHLPTAHKNAYRTLDNKDKPPRRQIVTVELSYANELEISEEEFTNMQKKFAHQTEAFWNATELGYDLSSVDLLIVQGENGAKFYIPRDISKQVLPSYLVEVKEEVKEEVKPEAEAPIANDSSNEGIVQKLISSFNELSLAKPEAEVKPEVEVKPEAEAEAPIAHDSSNEGIVKKLISSFNKVSL